jgi:hypothetical protein
MSATSQAAPRRTASIADFGLRIQGSVDSGSEGRISSLIVITTTSASTACCIVVRILRRRDTRLSRHLLGLAAGDLEGHDDLSGLMPQNGQAQPED